MIKEYTISNFKAFSAPATLPIKPITLIYGPNSAGKSSIIQSLLMLKHSVPSHDFDYFFKQMERFKNFEDSNSLNISGAYSDFFLKNNQSYKHVIYNQDINNEMEIKFSIDSELFFHHCKSTILKPETDKDEGASEIYIPGNMQKTLKISEMISCNCKDLSIGSKFAYDKESHTNLTKCISLYIGEGKSMVDYYHDEDTNTFSGSKVLINKDHEFWKEYWSKFGKDLAIRELNCVCNYMINSGNNLFGNLRKYGEFTGLIELNELINKGLEYDENLLVNYFQDHVVSSLIFFNTRPFYCKEIEVCDYSLDDPWDIETYYTLTDIMTGLKINNQKEYYSDNISIIIMLVSDMISIFLDGIRYLGPSRKPPEPFKSKAAEPEYQNYVGKEGIFLCKVLHDNKKYIEDINRMLEQIKLTYRVDIDEKFIWEEGQKYIENYLTVKESDKDYTLTVSDVGFGISQILPIVVQCLISKENKILIEQPELHLHPALQAELGDLFIDSALNKNNTLIIETHSEHLILRILRRIRETSEGELERGAIPITADQVAVVYVQPEKDGSKIIHIPVNKEGEFDRPWPKGFFAERAKELF